MNGVCLTVVKCDGSRFTADVLDETEARTGLGDLLPGAKVNLERALRLKLPAHLGKIRGIRMVRKIDRGTLRRSGSYRLVSAQMLNKLT